MSTMSQLDERVQEIEALGFDRTTYDGDAGAIRVACSKCEALVINGVPCHERGCVNATRECRGCTNRIPALRFRQFCEECS